MKSSIFVLLSLATIDTAMAQTTPVGIVESPCAYDPGLPLAEVRALDFGQLCHYEKDNAAIINARKRPRVVFYGDSITQGWGNDKEFFSPESGYVCRGIGGQTTSQLLVRFKPDVLDLRPKVIHILAGTNDIAGNTGPTTLLRVQNNFRSMVDQAKAKGIRVLIGSILPAKQYGWIPSIHPESDIKAMNAWLQDYARREKIGYIDYYSALDIKQDGSLPESLSPDGVHPNAKGFLIMNQLFRNALKE